MKMRTKHNYLMGVLFVLVIMLLSTVSFAADAARITITDGSNYSDTLPTGMAWDKDSSTLTLNNYNGGGINFRNDGGDKEVIINLSGNNTITVNETILGINFTNIKDVTFIGEGNLTINMTGTGNSRCGMAFFYTNEPIEPKLKFSGTGTVTINMTQNGNNDLCGIDMGRVYEESSLSGCELIIGENATLKINITNVSNYSQYGLSIDGSAEIKGTLEMNGTYTSEGNADSWTAIYAKDVENSSIGAKAHITVDYPTGAIAGNINQFKISLNSNTAINEADWNDPDNSYMEYSGEGFYIKCFGGNWPYFPDFEYYPILPAQVFTSGFNMAETKTYSKDTYTRTASLTTGSGAITYSSNNTDVATVNSSTGEVTIVGAGKAIITATAAMVTDTWAKTSVSYTLTVDPKPITVTVDIANRKFKEGNPTFISTVPVGALVGDDTIEGLGLGLHSEATTTSNVGSYDVIGDGTYNSNYYVTIVGTGKLVIGKADHGDETVSATVRYNNTAVQSIDVSGKILGDCGTFGEPSYYLPGPTLIDSFVYLSSDKALKFNLKSGIGEGDTEIVTTTIRTQNYVDYDIVATINIIEREIPTGTPSYTTINTIGKTLADAALTVGTITPAGSIKWTGIDDVELPGTTAVTANTSYTWLFIPTDSANYNTLTGTVKLYTKSSGGGGSSISSYKITVEESKNGDISPNTISVDKNEDIEFTITPDEGYEIENVLVDGISVGKESTYTFEKVTKKHTIKAIFTKIEEKPIEEIYYNDVRENDWYNEAIDYVSKNKLMNGVGNNNFAPNNNITRGMVVTVLYRLSGASETAKSTFIDVDEDEYYSEPIEWANKNEIVNGVGKGNFAPNKDITREEMAKMLYEYAKFMDIDVSIKEDTNISSYDDASDISDWAMPTIEWLCGEGILKGISEELFAAMGTATRAEFATVIMRLETIYEKL